MKIAKCIICGCDDLHACHDESGTPCSWLKVDYDNGIGLCSSCAQNSKYGHLFQIPNGEYELSKEEEEMAHIIKSFAEQLKSEMDEVERKYHILPMVSETEEGNFEGFLEIDNNETRTSEKHIKIFDSLDCALAWVKQLQAQKIEELLKTVSIDDIEYYSEPQIAGDSLKTFYD